MLLRQLCPVALLLRTAQVSCCPQTQSGDREWETANSSYCPEREEVTGGGFTAPFHFGSSGFNYTLQKDTAISICMKCSREPLTGLL